jgi:D-arabinose 5-phosphate isomerase GutQ
MIQISTQKGITLIGLTENADSPLALDADIFLPITISRETDSYNSQGTTRFTVMCVFFDAIQAALIEETGYRNEQFALIHPGGAVGERLNMKIQK